MNLFEFILKNLSYYFFLLLLTCYGYTFYSFLKKTYNLKIFLKTNKVFVLFSLLLTCIIFVSTPIDLKVFDDEAKLISISQSFFNSKQAVINTEAFSNHSELFPIKTMLPDRPLLFPFLLHIVHVVLGYSTNNVFVLNFLVSFFILFLILKTLNIFISKSLSLFSLLFIISHPIVPTSMTSGAFDLLFLLISFLSFYLLYKLHNDKSSGIQSLFLLTLVLLVNTRYEAIICSIPLLLLYILNLRKKKLNFYKISSYSIFGFIFLLPYFSARMIYKNSFFQSYTFNDFLTQNPNATNFFSLDNFYNNSKTYLHGLINFNYSTAYSNLILLLSLLSLLFLLCTTYKRHFIYKQKIPYEFIAFIFSCVLHFLVILSFALGSYTKPYTVRLFLLFNIMLSLLLPISLCKITKFSNPIIIFSSLFLLILNYPSASKDFYKNKLSAKIIYENTLPLFLAENPKANILIVGENNVSFTIHNLGSISFSFFNKHQRRIKTFMNSKLFNKIYFIQELKNVPRTVTPETLIYNKNKQSIKTVKEFRLDKNRFIRISMLQDSI